MTLEAALLWMSIHRPDELKALFNRSDILLYEKK